MSDSWQLLGQAIMTRDVDDDSVLVEFESHLDFISSYLDSISPLIRPVNQTIHDHPELAYHEFIAHKTLTTFLSSQEGWEVTPSAYDIPTAFIAVYDSGKPGAVVSFNAEYDCLPDIGHACGHNLIATSSLAAALATAATMKARGLAGKIVLFGTPAEEGGGGKIQLLEKGAYKDYQVDVSIMAHPGKDMDVALVRTSAMQALDVEYFGREAHAAANPWEGINALDALVVAYSSIAMLRQQLTRTDIVHGHITHGGQATNIIHAYTAATFGVRSDTRKNLAVLLEKVQQCFTAGATATGATVKITPTESYDDHFPNKELAACYRKHFNQLGGEIGTPEFEASAGATLASTDQGNVSYAIPSLHAGFGIPSEYGPHNPDFAATAGTDEAHRRAVRCGKALAATAVDVLIDAELLKRIKEEFARDVHGQ